MTKTTRTTKRTMRNPEAFIGKAVDTRKWNIPGLDDRYAICRYTGKLFDCWNTGATFNHHAFNRDWLINNGLYVEDAEWLSDEGFDQMMMQFDKLGIDYSECAFGGLEIPGITN